MSIRKHAIKPIVKYFQSLFSVYLLTQVVVKLLHNTLELLAGPNMNPGQDVCSSPDRKWNIAGCLVCESSILAASENFFFYLTKLAAISSVGTVNGERAR